MSKYTAVAHDFRREIIQRVRDIMMASPALLKDDNTVAKRIGAIFAHMPMKKKDFTPINGDIDYLLQERITSLVAENLRTEWISACESLKG